jgi:L-alanine-DL-glutamate epimerase-like enolase superfamily enzyme
MARITRRAVMSSIAALGAGSPAVAAPASAKSMRISRYELMPVRVPMHERVREAWQASFFRQGRFQTHYEMTLLRLHTDEGLTGIADAAMSGIGKLNVARAESVLNKMVGHSPWEYLLDDSLGGILVAVYDLVGQACGLPVSRLFAANPKDRIIRTWWSQCYPPPLMAAEARLAASLGYRVHKIKVRPWEDPVKQVAAICEAVPKDYRVWADANSSWESVGRTLFFLDQLKQFHNLFGIESPFRRDASLYRELKGKAALRVAEHMVREPMPFIRENLVGAFVVGEMLLGKTTVQRALMAEVTGIPLWIEHSPYCGINHVFQAHQTAAFPGIEYAVSMVEELEDDVVVEPFRMENGFYQVPLKPGLGITLDENAVEKYRVSTSP